MEKHGHNNVEAFIDQVLSIENLIDVHHLFEKVNSSARNEDDGQEGNDDERSMALKSYMRSKAKTDAKNNVDIDIKKEDEAQLAILTKDIKLPERDIMKFLMDYAPLHEWQTDILGILREEAYYFLPQRMTKIMNEGWASYWHEKIMTERAVTANELIDFADHHAGVLVMSPKQINPYKVGIELLKDVEYRWDTGRFGKDYEECENMVERAKWDTKVGKGRDKIFEIRASHNDISFIDEFLTPEFCNRQQIFTYKFNPRTGRNEVDSRDFAAIKQNMLSSLTNFGSPVIEIEDANFANRGELLLAHRHQGVDLDMRFAQETMKNIHGLWKRPVNLVTKYDGKEVTFCFDGEELKPLT